MSFTIIATFSRKANNMMTLRQKFDKMMGDGCGYVRLNNISGIERITMDAFGHPCDCLFLRFLYVTGKNKGGTMFSINQREYSQVLIEVAERTRDFLNNLGCELAIDLMHEEIT